MTRARDLADGALYKITPSTSGNLLTSDGSNWTSATPPVELPAHGADGNILTSTGSAWISETPAAQPTHLPVTGSSAGTIPYQTAVNQTAHTAVGTAGQVLQSNATSAPTWVDKSAVATPTGVATVMKFS